MVISLVSRSRYSRKSCRRKNPSPDRTMSEENPPRCLDVNVVPTIADDPQRVTLAKGVNDTLNAYIGITDGKAVAFLGGSTAAASYFLSHRPDGPVLLVFYAVSAVAYALGAIACVSVI